LCVGVVDFYLLGYFELVVIEWDDVYGDVMGECFLGCFYFVVCYCDGGVFEDVFVWYELFDCGVGWYCLIVV